MGFWDSLGLGGVFGSNSQAAMNPAQLQAMQQQFANAYQAVTVSNSSGTASWGTPLHNLYGAMANTGYAACFTGSVGWAANPTFLVKHGISYPESDRFRLSVALTEWGLALDDGHVRAVPQSKPKASWMDGAELHPVKEMPEGYFVVWHKRMVQIYQMSTPLDEGLVRAQKLEKETDALMLDETLFKAWTVG